MKSINHQTQKTVNFISKGPHPHLTNFCFFCETICHQFCSKRGTSVPSADGDFYFLQALPVFKGAVVKSDIFINSHALDLKENAGKCH